MKFDKPATENPIDQLKVVGRPHDRIDGPLKTTGTAPYAYEWHDLAPNVAYGCMVGAGIAKGRITAMDTEAAQRAPGVLAVVTADNAGPLGKGEMNFASLLGGPEIAHYHQAIALVVAETFEQATAAAALVRVDYQREPGAYDLDITPRRAIVVGYDAAGAFYGLMSILSLIPTEGAPRIATLEAHDSPRFAYRGAFLDVARNFHSKQAVMRLLDQMAAWKMNRFHFHLSDDEGWRIEIPGLPELTEVGAKRCHDLSEQRCLLPQLGSGPFSDNNGSGYFSRADYIEIVKYAQARHIQVIPEIDMPAHARAAVIAMEARYQRLMKEGQSEQASAYRLIDPTDDSNTTSVQLYDRTSYLNPCIAG